MSTIPQFSPDSRPSPALLAVYEDCARIADQVRKERAEAAKQTAAPTAQEQQKIAA